MIEPEMAFCDLEADMDLAEEKLRFLVAHALEHCHDELEFFNQFVDKSLLQQLNRIKEKDFARISYTEAVRILQKSGQKFVLDPYLYTIQKRWVKQRLGTILSPAKKPVLPPVFYQL